MSAHHSISNLFAEDAARNYLRQLPERQQMESHKLSPTRRLPTTLSPLLLRFRS